MGKHKEWRKIVKKERRRRIRTKLAKERENFPSPNSDKYQEWLNEQETLEMLELNQIEMSNEEENEKWMRAELLAAEQWRKLQLKRDLLNQQQQQHQAKLKLEWEMEKQRKEKEVERLRQIEEENRVRQEKFTQNLENYLNGDSVDPPQELLILYESKPNCNPCPFFTKTACCRFGDECSRNHKYPGISKILLATNLFGHFGLENTNFNEYDTDIMLEFEDSDTYKDFKDFFYDVLPEFQKFGKVVEFKVCNNYEKHLRGNTYIEYTDIRSAVLAYRALHTRWYGGKQLSLQFCQLTSWSNAICGLQSTRRCPKGRACNFLHVFKNPIKLFSDEFKTSKRRTSAARSWRWSESPERTSPKHKHKENEKMEKRNKDNRHYRYRSRSRSSHRKK